MVVSSNETAPRQLTAEEFKNRLQLTAEETSAVNCRGILKSAAVNCRGVFASLYTCFSLITCVYNSFQEKVVFSHRNW